MNTSSFIQTILSVSESHRFSHTARGLYRRSGITPCPEDTLSSCIYSIAHIMVLSTGFRKQLTIFMFLVFFVEKAAFMA